MNTTPGTPKEVRLPPLPAVIPKERPFNLGHAEGVAETWKNRNKIWCKLSDEEHDLLVMFARQSQASMNSATRAIIRYFFNLKD